jgi:glycosyltransferase involved in cell wall biosynthesis
MENAGGVLACDCDLTLFVACYNEEAGIVPTLETIVAAAGEAGRSYDIVIIDDASTDQSVPKIQTFIAAHPEVKIKLLVNHVNQGLGNNFAEAAFHGHGKYYRLVCGDNVESKEVLAGIFKRLGQADIILSYHDSDCRGFSRKHISRLFTSLVNLLSGYKLKYYNGVPVTLRQDVMRWHSNCHGFGFQADLVTRLLDLGASFIEVPVRPQERESGASKALTFKNLCSVAHSLLEIFIRRVARIMYPKAYQAMRAQRRAAAAKTAPRGGAQAK